MRASSAAYMLIREPRSEDYRSKWSLGKQIHRICSKLTRANILSFAYLNPLPIALSLYVALTFIRLHLTCRTGIHGGEILLGALAVEGYLSGAIGD